MKNIILAIGATISGIIFTTLVLLLAFKVDVSIEENKPKYHVEVYCGSGIMKEYYTESISINMTNVKFIDKKTGQKLTLKGGLIIIEEIHNEQKKVTER